LDNPTVHEQGQNTHEWFYGQNNVWEKVPAFLRSHKYRGEKQENSRITVSVFLCTFELTALLFKKFPPPPALLHHSMRRLSDSVIFGPDSQNSGTDIFVHLCPFHYFANLGVG